jgi:transcriptional regulator with XRE-family HTH domain
MATGASKIKRAREAVGFSQRALAKKARISTMTVFRLEHGKHAPTTTTLARIARALKRPVKDLLP